MEKKYAYFIVIGLILGGIFGIFFGAAAENQILGVGIGALAGVFLGWFAAVIAQNMQNEKKG